jgi:chloramphenicol 3-O-phosphotransferase
VSGIFAGALVVLAVILVAAWLVALARDVPGPGALVLGVHAASAAGALALQRVADRNGGWLGTSAALIVVTLVGLVCGLYWWA